MCIICHSNIILATYGAMLTLCLFHIKLKRMSRFGDNICVHIKITLSVMLCLMKTYIFPGDICLNPKQSRFTDCIVNPHHPCVTDLV